MSKILCLFSLALSLILAVVFILGRSMGIPFKQGSIMMDVIFLAAALVVAVQSWLTFREQ